MYARTQDTRLSKAGFSELIQNPASNIISLPCNALLKAVPTGTAFPYDGFTLSSEKEPYMFTSADNAIEFYGEANQTVNLIDCQLFVHIGLGCWELVGVST